MYLLRAEKDGELILVDQSEDFEYLKDRFELEIIYMTCRGLKEKEGYDVKIMHREFERDGKWNCALILAQAIVANVNTI